MDGKQAAEMARMDHHYFLNTIRAFDEEDANEAPLEGVMTAAQQIRHVAQTVSWFREGAWGAGFNMDFEALEAANREPVTLAQARAALDAAFADFAAFLETQSPEELMAPMPDNPIFGPAPRVAVLRALCDHTAHHRGALAVYLRLAGKVPTMPYMD